jgi:glyoxylase-like metal-dependent hydrolase (beta-lactamase superfamily II)
MTLILDRDTSAMTCFICETCGTQHAESSAPHEHCVVCEDERQYVGWNGQSWTTLDALRATHTLRIEDDAGLPGIGMAPDFAIPQRALLLPTDAGNILWECVSLITDEAVAALQARGGVDRIVISHPHFYASMVEWSEALGGVPILLHEADREWVLRSSKRIAFWNGDALQLSDAVTLIRCGGHFQGSTALHWRDGPRAGGALFPGDALQVVLDRRHVTFMYSYPNYIPMKASDVRAMRERLAGFGFEDVYGYTWGRNIIGGARVAVDASFERFLNAATG